jgi:hypothetical protein
MNAIHRGIVVSLLAVAIAAPCQAERPASPCCEITAVAPDGTISARDLTTGETFRFAPGDPAGISHARIGQKVYADRDTGQVWIDEGHVTGTLGSRDLSVDVDRRARLGAALRKNPRYQGVTLELTGTQFHYNERFTPPFKSSERGWIPGGAVSFRSMQLDGAYFEARGEVSAGHTTYDGSLVNLTTGDVIVPFLGTTDNIFARGEVLAGYTVAAPARVHLAVTPYFGLGVRYWRRDLAGGANILEVVESYVWPYVSVGGRIDWWWRQVTLSPEVAGRFPFAGNLHVSDPSANLTLGNRPGYIAKLTAGYRIGPSLIVHVSGAFEESRIGQSDVKAVFFNGHRIGILEPTSKTEQITVGVGVTYLFQ